MTDEKPGKAKRSRVEEITHEADIAGKEEGRVARVVGGPMTKRRTRRGSAA
jgi:hypothetical protein